MPFSRYFEVNCFALSLACQSLCQTPPVEIKGHHIGEKFVEFEIKQGMQQQAQDCNKFFQDPATQKRIANGVPKKISDYASWSEFKLRVENCNKLADAFEGKTVEMPITFKDGTRTQMTFVDSKLVQIMLSFSETQAAGLPVGIFGPLLSFDDVLRDLTAKFGRPDVIGQRQMQNGFGAVFTFPEATWTSRQDVRIYATQNRDGTVTHLTTVQIQERAYGDRIIQSKNARPNSLQ
jgi:hypothetical protein